MAAEPPLLPVAGLSTSRLAIWSLVLGCLAIVFMVICLGPVFAIPAVLCGHLASGRIKRSGGLLAGEGMALAGLITGYVSIGLSVILIPMLVAIAVPNFFKARATAQENFCINNLRRIEGAKRTWALEQRKTAEDEPAAGELTPYLGTAYSLLRCPQGGHYTINKVGQPPTCSVPKHRLPGADGQAETQ